jgi:cytochrome P450
MSRLSTVGREIQAKPMRGLHACRWYVDFFRDPVGCLCRAYRQIGPVAVAGQVVPGLGQERRHVFALGPDFNRQVLGDPATFRTTGQFLRGPAGSALRRVREGLTAMNGEKHRRQRQLILPLFTKERAANNFPTSYGPWDDAVVPLRQ